MRSILTIATLACTLVTAPAADGPLKPMQLHLHLARIADTEANVPEYVFVIGATAYRTVDGLKLGLRSYPSGSRLTWDPGCDRQGDEPLLSSAADLRAFSAHCAAIGIDFVMVPSG